jgi:hypothetical protein
MKPSIVKRRRPQLSAETVCLAGPAVSRHIHRKLRILAIRKDCTLGSLVIELIETHPCVVALESEFGTAGLKGDSHNG